MAPHTRRLAEVLACAVAAAGIARHGTGSNAPVDGVLANPSARCVGGTLATAAGLAGALTSAVWTGGFVPAATSLLLWALLAKGLMLLLPPADVLRLACRPLLRRRALLASLGGAALFGLALAGAAALA